MGEIRDWGGAGTRRGDHLRDRGERDGRRRGVVQRALTASGGTTTLASGNPFTISFSFDTDSLELIGSGTTSAGYCFAMSDVVARIADLSSTLRAV